MTLTKESNVGTIILYSDNVCYALYVPELNINMSI